MTNSLKNVACTLRSFFHQNGVEKFDRAVRKCFAVLWIGFFFLVGLASGVAQASEPPLADGGFSTCSATGDWLRIRPNDVGLADGGPYTGSVDASTFLGLTAGSVELSYSNAQVRNSGANWMVENGGLADKATFTFTGSLPVRIRASHGALLPGAVGVRDGILSEDNVDYSSVAGGNFDTTRFALGRTSYGAGLHDYFVEKTLSEPGEDNFGTLNWYSQGFATELSFYSTSSSPTNNHSIFVCIPEADLSIEKAVNSMTPDVGDTVTFTLTATNNGPDSAPGVVVTDQLPSGYAYVSDNGGVATVENSGEIVWTIGTLANGADVSLQITATVLATGDYANTATIAGDYPDPDLSNNSTTVTPVPVFAPPVASGDDSLGNPVGEPVTLDVAANDTAATGRVLDPASVTLVDADGTPVTAPLVVAGEGTWSVDPTTGAISFAPQTGFEGDPTPVRYTIADDQGNVSDPATVSVGYLRLPSIAITKTSDVADDVLPLVGADIIYTITVENTGNVTLFEVQVSDPLIGLDVTLAQMVPGATEVFTGAYTVTAEDFIAAQVFNTAKVTAKGPDDTIIEAEVTLAVPENPGSISGTVFLDRDGNGVLGDGDLRLEGYIVELRDSNGTLVATAISDAQGFYTFDPVVGRYEYAVIFRRPDGAIIGSATVSVGEGEDVTNVDLPIDPAGVVYDSVTRAPLAGVTIVLADSGGTPLPAICVGPGQQSQVTGASGAYQFDVFPGAGGACPVGLTEYRLIVTGAPDGYGTTPSVVLPPQGPLQPPTGAGTYEVVPFDRAPQIGEDTTYHLAFLLQGGGTPSFDVIHNHVPLDGQSAVPAPADLEIEKTAGVSTVRVGDLLTYQIAIRNRGTIDSVIDVIDTLPEGFVYREGSAAIAGDPVVPVASGQSLRFEQVVARADAVTNLTLTVYVTSSVPVGTHINRAQMFNAFTGAPIGELATAPVRVEGDPVFQCSTVIGRVFDDLNHDGYFNAEPREDRFSITDQIFAVGKGKFWSEPAPNAQQGEKGLPGVRLVTPNGIAVTTDAHGRFSLPCAALPRDIGSNFMLKLDDRTLPVGYRLTTENPRVVRLTPGMLTKMNFGAAMFPVARVDLSARAFTAQGGMRPELQAGLQSLVAQLSARPSVLRLSYQASGQERDSTGTARLRVVEREIRRLWSGTGRYALTIERVVERPASKPAQQ